MGKYDQMLQAVFGARQQVAPPIATPTVMPEPVAPVMAPKDNRDIIPDDTSATVQTILWSGPQAAAAAPNKLPEPGAMKTADKTSGWGKVNG